MARHRAAAAGDRAAAAAAPRAGQVRWRLRAARTASSGSASHQPGRGSRRKPRLHRHPPTAACPTRAGPARGRLDLVLGGGLRLRDQFLWDLHAAHPTPEEFAAELVADCGIGAQHGAAVAAAIRIEVSLQGSSLPAAWAGRRVVGCRRCCGLRAEAGAAAIAAAGSAAAASQFCVL